MIVQMNRPKIYPVIHHLDRETSVREAGKAVAAGADGAFLIAHRGNDGELISVASGIRNCYAGFPIGINLLSTSAIAAVETARQLQFPMIWGDDFGVDSTGLTAAGNAIHSIAKAQGKNLQIFASVAFKYRPHESDPAQAAKNALASGFIPITSGSGTGSPPELSKIKSMSEATGGVLAVASGMTPGNVAQFAPYLTHILVATGIAINEHEMDVEMLRLLIANARKGQIAAK